MDQNGMGATRCRLRRVGGLVGFLVLISLAGAARAQPIAVYFPEGVPGFDTMPGVTVLSRTRPDYDPPGIHAGSFLIHPSFEEGFGYDSNVLGGTGSPGSWILGTHAQARANSTWSQDGASAVLGVDNQRDLDTPQQSRTDATAAAGGTVTFGRDTLTLGAAWLLRHQDRTMLDAVPSDTPIPFSVGDLRADYTAVFDRLSLTPNVEFTTLRYGNTTVFGVPTSESYQNRNVLAGGVTARYEVMPLLNAILVARGIGTRYVSPAAGQPSSNSTSALLLVGVSDDRDAVWRYRLLVGWEQRAFAASVYPTHNAPIIEGQLIWVPSGMTTVTATVTRSIEDAAQQGVSGYTYNAARLTVDHEYRRDLLLQVTGGVQQADYLQGGRQTSALLGAGVTWLVNRRLRVALTYSFNDQEGGGSGTSGPFTRSVGLLSMRYGW
jgi:hypothetical protein